MMMSEINMKRFGFVQKPVILPAPMEIKAEKKVLQGFGVTTRPKISKEYNTATENIEYIQTQVAEYFGISVEELIGKSRKLEYMIPRHTSIALCDTLLTHTMRFIAKNHGGRNHATGINSVKVVESIAFTSSVYREQFAKLKQKLENYFKEN